MVWYSGTILQTEHVDKLGENHGRSAAPKYAFKFVLNVYSTIALGCFPLFNCVNTKQKIMILALLMYNLI